MVDSSCRLVVPGLKAEFFYGFFAPTGFRLTRASEEDEYVCDVGGKYVVWLFVVPRVLGGIDV